MKFKLETITPVHIGSGEILSQFSDYIYDDGFVYYLEYSAIMEELAKKPNCDELIDQFIEVIKNQASGNNRNRFSIKNFMEELGLDYQKYCSKKVKSIENIKEQIQLNIKTTNYAYIPGSTIKGAIRTALISHHYEDEESSIKRNYIGEDIFGKTDKDILKFLLVSDTNTFSQEDLKISKFCKLNLKNKKTDIPIVKEVIDEGKSTTFTINCRAKNNQVGRTFSYLYEGQEGELLPIINKYTQKNIEIELLELLKFSGNEIKELKDFYHMLLKTVESIDSSKEAIIRIGAGKSFYDNTIAQKLSKNKLKKIVKDNFKKADINFFPKTRTIITEGLNKKVPGWIKISSVSSK